MRILAAALFLAIVGAPAVGAQARAEWPSAQQLLRSFEQASRGGNPAGLGGINAVLSQPDDFPAAKVDSLLDGLVHLAIQADDERVRTNAFSFLASAGLASVDRPVAGVAARLVQVHERAEAATLRTAAVQKLGFQAERIEAARALRGIAVRDAARQRTPEAGHDAVWALTHLGREGEAALREIHAGNLARDPGARAAIGEIAAQRGWAHREP